MTTAQTFNLVLIGAGVFFWCLHLWQWKRGALDNVGRLSLVLWAFTIIINAAMFVGRQ